jgi:uncharacterized glyoxalase superfamily protein PhnB
MPVKPVPDGYRTVTPYLTVADLPALLEFVQAAFAAKVVEQAADASGKVRHAEFTIGDSRVMAGQARDEWPARPGGLYLYVEDTDATYQAALRAGGTSLMEPADQFYGDRNAGVQDPQGNYWWIATRFEDLTPEELQRRSAEQMK